MTGRGAGWIWARPWAEPPSRGGRLRFDAGTVTAVEDAPPEGSDFILPGLINAHDHGRGLRPLAYGAPDGPLEAWLWDLWRAPLTDVYLSHLVAFGQMALSGVTTVVHNHLLQSQDLVGEARDVARAARDVGIRLAFVVPVLDRNLAGYDGGAAVRAALPPDDWKALQAAQAQPHWRDQVARVAEVAAAIDGPGIVTQYGPPGPQWLSEEGLAAVGEAAAGDGRRVHVHVLETLEQRRWMDAECSEGAAAFFDRAGLLTDRLTVAHGVFLTEAEIAAFRSAGATLALNVSSNLRLTSGLPSGAALAAGGLRLGLGLDGLALDDDADMLKELRLATVLLGPRRFDEPGLTRAAVLRAAFSEGRVAFDGQADSGLVDGEAADWIALDLDALAPDLIDRSPEAVAEVVLGRASRAAVREVAVGGRVIVRDGTLTGADLGAAEAELAERARADGVRPPTWLAAARAARIRACEAGA